MTRREVQHVLQRIPDRCVLVLGDVMLDQFVFGQVDRISPEAPVPVVRFEREAWRLGGAANVAQNVRALGAEALLVGVAGTDEAGQRLRAELAHADISDGSLVEAPGRCTTRKLRVVTRRNQQVARIDYEADEPLPVGLERGVVQKLEMALDRAAVLIVSDYLKGVVSQQVASQAIALARAAGVPVLVDPKVPHVDYYRGATLVTPNHHEAEAVTLLRIRTDEDASQAAHAFRGRANCGAVLITRGEHGMWLLDGERDHALPATAREVADVTGAGDTVIAMIGAGVAAGASLPDAARLANLAAGLVVAKFGAASVTADELLSALPGE